MTTGNITVQRPVEAPAEQLVLLYHGVGGTPRDMALLGQRLAHEFPRAAVICVAAREACDFGRGLQWFSVQGITEENRVQRVADAMPHFLDTVRHWQHATGVSANATALVGFAQGALMALESTQVRGFQPIAGRIVSIAGRFAREPENGPHGSTLHMIHGKNDPVIHYGHTVRAAERLLGLDADVTADVIPFLGHEVSREVEQLLIERLKGYLPKRVWTEALRSAPAGVQPHREHVPGP